MEYVTEQRKEDGIVKVLMYYFRRFHKHDDFEKAFKNHQDKGNFLSQTNFLTSSILW
jgi:hypothetical protein